MQVEGRDNALSILKLINNNAANVKKLSPAERRAVTTMLTSLHKGSEIQMPSDKVLTKIHAKLSGGGTKRSVRQKTAQLARIMWSEAVGVATNRSSGDIQKLASRAAVKESWRDIAKHTDTPEFKSSCDRMRTFYQTLKVKYQTQGYQAAASWAAEHSDALAYAEANSLNTPREERAFILTLELPAIDTQVRLLQKEGTASKLSERWDAKIENWDNPAKIKAMIERRARLA